MRFFLLVFLLILGIIQTVTAQSFHISGKITDSQTHEALAFVNITYDDDKKGVISNIDGQFSIFAQTKPKVLNFNLLGYEKKAISTDSLHQGVLNISLKNIPQSLQEVVVLPGKNPAHRIINKVLENRNLNNPEKMGSFSYTAYNKMHFTFQKEKVRLDSLLDDTISNPAISGSSVRKLNKPYLLLMEFISDRKFKYPDKNQEKVIASRVSGFKDPSFTILATQLQSFSFYNDFIVLLDKYYLNPISPGSTSRYFFLMQDTFLTESMDTLYEISFRPAHDRNFDGMKGVLYINTHGYAIQNVIAEAYPQNQSFAIKIRQRYDQIDAKQWFPTQLNTQLAFRNLVTDKNTRDLTFIGSGKTYFYNIKLNPDMSATRFSPVEVSVAPEASHQSDSLWAEKRKIPLSGSDSATYHLLDSLGRKYNLDQKLEIWETVSTGYIPLGYVNVDLRKFLNYNEKEGIRVGLGIQTNNYFSDHFSIGGQYAYGISDKNSKYGAFLQLFPSWASDTRFTLRYTNDVTETGGYRFLDDQFVTSTEMYRNFLVNRMDKFKGIESSFSFRAFSYLKVRLAVSSADRSLAGYTFISPEETYTEKFKLTEMGMELKFSFKEKFVQTPRGRMISMGTKYPILWFNFRQGVDLWGGQIVYKKYETRFYKTFTTRSLGKTGITLLSGYADKPVPLSLNYNGHESYSKFSLDAENTFATMRMNEFYSSKYISAFFSQNFESLLFKRGKFKPEIVWSLHTGFGSMSHPEYHQGIAFKTMEKGFYETGLIFNKLLNQKIFGYGLGIYYRFGPYSFARIGENFGYKVSLTFNL